MRVVALVLASTILALAAAGCGGGDDEPSRSPAVEKLAAVCEQARTDIEALGLPSEAGFEVLKPWSARGKKLVREIEAIDGATPDEQTQLDQIAKELGEYYAGLALGYEIYRKTKSSEAYAQSIDRASEFLASAEKRAIALGADECAVRPFPDE